MVPNGAPNRYPSGCFTAEKSKQIRTCFPRFLSSVRPSVHPFVPLPLRAIVFVPARPILPCPLQCASPSQHTTPEHVLSRVRNVPTICSFLPLSLSHSLSLSLSTPAHSSSSSLRFAVPNIRVRILLLPAPHYLPSLQAAEDAR